MKIVISGYYGFGNFGDEVILSLLVNHLKNHEVVVLSSNPRKTSFDNNVNSVNSFDFHAVSGVIKNSDVLISGGGSLLQDVTSLKSLIYYLWVIFTALFYKKKVIIFAQGIGPINNPIARFVTVKILKNCDYISVRDEKSGDFLKSCDVDCELLCDPVFEVEAIHKKNISNTVAVQLRDFATMNDVLLNKLARQIVKDFYDRNIVILSLQDSVDLGVCKRFKTILNNISPNLSVEVLSGLKPGEVFERICGFDFLIAMRFHALVCAIKSNVKCCAINYDVKVERLANDFGIPLISTDASEDFDVVFDKMKAESSDDLRSAADMKVFDWSGIDKILMS